MCCHCLMPLSSTVDAALADSQDGAISGVVADHSYLSGVCARIPDHRGIILCPGVPDRDRQSQLEPSLTGGLIEELPFMH